MGLIAISSLMLLGGMYLMIAFAWWLLQIIANWRIFTKAGEADDTMYNDELEYVIVGSSEADPFNNRISNEIGRAHV